jgi:threonylcarbamoyladenosine tRNA methylthiotransferase MtaB
MGQAPEKTIALETVGCRLNQYETEKMAAALMRYGFRRVEPDETADLYVINTCTVTHRADSDCRQIIRKAGRKNPEARVVVTGCYVDVDPERVKGMEGVDAVLRNADKDRIAEILPDLWPELFSSGVNACGPATITDFFGHNRAWLKVSDGCNQACSYCIVPSVRGRLKNRAVAEVIDDVNNFVVQGYNEVVLTGVNLGHYSSRSSEPQVRNLAELCERILAETGVRRIRLSSIEPQTIREELLAVYASSQGRICRHFHVPLQSGSSRILKLMRRPYDPETYLRRVQQVKDVLPNTVVGADVLVGFPGETDEDFRQTVDVVTSGLIDYLHVFSYSERPGTTAAAMGAPVGHEVVKQRNQHLTRTSDELLARALQRQIGETLDVIAEHKRSADESFWAVADNYLKVKLPAWVNGGKDLVRVRITEAHEDFVQGDVLT